MIARRAGLIGLSEIVVMAVAPRCVSAADRDPDFEPQVIRPLQLSAIMRRRSKLLLIDIRQPAEYAVSHLPGARRLDEATSTAAVIDALGPAAHSALVVCYCVIGHASHDFTLRIDDALIERGASKVATLEGGVLGWHDLGLPLVDSKGSTPYVHPHDEAHAQLMKRRSLARFAPRT